MPEQTDREAEIWRLLWARPQAVEWERQTQDLEVALFVRRLAEAERPGSPAQLSILVRQMSDSLGLTTPGMRANRWLIVDDTPAPAEAVGPRSSSRDRLRVVAADDGA